VANAATNYIIPPVSLTTQNIATSDGVVIAVTVPEGNDKPYQAKDGFYYVKRGADKRKVTNRDELRRLFQEAHAFHADDRPVAGSSIIDLDRAVFRQFYEDRFHSPAPDDEGALLRELAALRLIVGDQLSLTGMLLMGIRPQRFVPEFSVKAVWFKGTSRSGTDFYDSRIIEGTLPEQFEQGMAFFHRWNARLQSGSFNTPTVPEVPEITFEELLVNALVHRDYYIRDSVKLFIFDDRIEIRSPGRMPNSLTVGQALRGIRRDRNPNLLSLAYRLMKYRGLASGLLRAVLATPELKLEEDSEAEEVTATIPLQQRGSVDP
jgi:ATP-dependent DNA helicase RecG